jgi:hypothetical protein
MPTVNLCCHEFVVAISSVACIVGLWLLKDHNQAISKLALNNQYM